LGVFSSAVSIWGDRFSLFISPKHQLVRWALGRRIRPMCLWCLLFLCLFRTGHRYGRLTTFRQRSVDHVAHRIFARREIVSPAMFGPGTGHYRLGLFISPRRGSAVSDRGGADDPLRNWMGTLFGFRQKRGAGARPHSWKLRAGRHHFGCVDAFCFLANPGSRGQFQRPIARYLIRDTHIRFGLRPVV